MKAPKACQLRWSGVFFVYFEQYSHVLMSIFLTINTALFEGKNHRKYSCQTEAYMGF